MAAMTAWLRDPNPSSRWQAKLGQTYFGWLRLRRNPLAMVGPRHRGGASLHGGLRAADRNA